MFGRIKIIRTFVSDLTTNLTARQPPNKNKERYKMKTTNTIEAKVNGQIFFSKGSGLFVGNIVEIKEKAIKVDYVIEPPVLTNGVIVYCYSTWIPKSVLINDKELSGVLSVKKWFASKFEGGYRIKKYFIENGKSIFI